MPATVDSVRIYLGLDPASTVDEAAMAAAVAAGNDMVTTWRPDLTLDADGVELTDWPPRCDQAANIQSARLYGRRGSVQGIAAFADLGAVMLARMDPDVRALLELGEFQQSVTA